MNYNKLADGCVDLGIWLILSPFAAIGWLERVCGISACRVSGHWWGHIDSQIDFSCWWCGAFQEGERVDEGAVPAQQEE